MRLKVPENATPKPALPHSCGGCGSRWSGYNVSHCSVCHRTFSGVTYFDIHRSGDECRDPEVIGLVLKNRTYAFWGSPDEIAPGTFD